MKRILLTTLALTLGLATASLRAEEATQAIEVNTRFFTVSAEAAVSLGLEPAKDQLRPPLRNPLDHKLETQLYQQLSGIKDADILSAPSVSFRSGQRALVQITREFLYPTSYAEERFTPTGKGAAPDAEAQLLVTPSEFAQENVGIELEVEGSVLEGNLIKLNCEPRLVTFEGFTTYLAAHRTDENGQKLARRIQQPVFTRITNPTQITLRPGQALLLGGFPNPETQSIAENAESPPVKVEVPKLLYVIVSARITTDGPPPPAPPTESRPADAELPVGIPIEGKPGFCRSPFVEDPNSVIDARGLPAGTEIMCPYTRRMFRLP